jgi:hypothetical protein
MNKRILSVTLLFAVLSSGGLFAASSTLIPAMAALDKAYIPVLGLSGQADQQARAKAAFTTFENVWKDFKTTFAAQDGFDAEWPEDLEKVNHAVAKAKTVLLDNSNGPAAHEALEAVRMVLLESRTRLKIPYFIDSLTLFHNSMEDLLNNKPAKKFADWTTSEKMGFAADLDVAIARWKKVKAMEGLISDAALSPKADETYKSQWQAINAIMAGTKSAFEAGDEKTFSEKLGQLKPNFIKTFFLFGDFPR